MYASGMVPAVMERRERIARPANVSLASFRHRYRCGFQAFCVICQVGVTVIVNGTMDAVVTVRGFLTGDNALVVAILFSGRLEVRRRTRLGRAVNDLIRTITDLSEAVFFRGVYG